MPHDPKTYREMSQPFQNHDAASAAIEAFAKSLSEIRAQHRIAEVFCIVAVTYDEDGDEREIAARLHHGSSLRSPQLAAYGYGLETASQEANIQRIVGEAMKSGRSTKGH